MAKEEVTFSCDKMITKLRGRPHFERNKRFPEWFALDKEIEELADNIDQYTRPQRFYRPN